MNDMRRSELSRKVYGWLVRGGIAAEMNVWQHIQESIGGRASRKFI